VSSVPTTRVNAALLTAPMLATTPTVTTTAPTLTLVPTTPSPLVIPLAWPTNLFAPPVPVTGSLWPAPATAPLI
jgi:hypothetical protein